MLDKKVAEKVLRSVSMAKVVDRKIEPIRRARYPWGKWADGRTWLLVRGQDYTVSDRAMISAARWHAKAHGLSLAAETDESVGVLIRFVEKTPVKLTMPSRPFKDFKK